MTQGAEAGLRKECAGETQGIRIFDSYVEAAAEAAQQGAIEGFVAKVQRSPYGPGFIVRSVPVEFLTHPELRRQFVRPIQYSEL